MNIKPVEERIKTTRENLWNSVNKAISIIEQTITLSTHSGDSYCTIDIYDILDVDIDYCTYPEKYPDVTDKIQQIMDAYEQAGYDAKMNLRSHPVPVANLTISWRV